MPRAKKRVLKARENLVKGRMFRHKKILLPNHVATVLQTNEDDGRTAQLPHTGSSINSNVDVPTRDLSNEVTTEPHVDIEVKVEPVVDEEEIKFPTEFLETGEQINFCEPCLICCQNNGRLFAGNVDFPDTLGATGIHPKQVENDMKIIYLLKSVFKVSGEQLLVLMKLSNGEYPGSWIYLCGSCRDLVSKALQVHQRLLEIKKEMHRCRMDIVEKMKSVKTKSIPEMSKTIRKIAIKTVCKLNDQGSSTNSFMEGDQEATRRLKRKRKILAVDNDPLGDGYAPVSPAMDDDFDWDPDYPINSDGDFGNDRVSGKPKRKSRKPKLVLRKEEYQFPEEMNELFICPICKSENPDGAVGLNIVRFLPHVIFHYDNPIRCSQCKISLPKNADALKSHWEQYHSDISVDGPLEQQFSGVVMDEIQWPWPNLCVSENSDRNPDTSTSTSSIKCTDCVGFSFSKMNELRLHQIMKHPETARVSCPLCPRLFKNSKGQLRKFSLEYHLCNDHLLSPEFHRPSMCQFCGEILPSYTPVHSVQNQSQPNYSLMFHMISRHSALIKLSYTCTTEEYYCEDLNEFLEHLKSVHATNSNSNVKSLLHFKDDFSGDLRCGLCETDCVFNYFNSPGPGTVLAHLALTHSLYLKWKWNPFYPNKMEVKIWKSIKDYLIHVKKTRSYSQRVAIRNKKKVDLEEQFARGRAHYLASRPAKYACEKCPHLEKMNVDYFIQHLIFHWRRPSKCTRCSLHLPLTPEVIENHWTHSHPDSAHETSSKANLVEFRPGKIFECGRCPTMFEFVEDRDIHERNIHNVNTRSNVCSCNVCNKSFRNLEEMRVHKALEHPEIANEACYYCDEVFMMEGSEGARYRDYEALHAHIMARDDHPKFKSSAGSISHLDPCQYCGMVIVFDYKDPGAHRICGHVERTHGIHRTRSVTCHICNQDMGIGLYKHFQTTHFKLTFCEKCGKEMKPCTIPEHLLTHHDIPTDGYTVLHCQESSCEYKTYSKQNMRCHVRTNHKERVRNHFCQFCGKGFLEAGKKTAHEQAHQNKETKPFQCEVCGASFAVKNYLYIHRRLSHLNRKFPSTNKKRSGTSKSGNRRKSAPQATMNEGQEL